MFRASRVKTIAFPTIALSCLSTAWTQDQLFSSKKRMLKMYALHQKIQKKNNTIQHAHELVYHSRFKSVADAYMELHPTGSFKRPNWISLHSHSNLPSDEDEMPKLELNTKSNVMCMSAGYIPEPDHIESKRCSKETESSPSPVGVFKIMKQHSHSLETITSEKEENAESAQMNHGSISNLGINSNDIKTTTRTSETDVVVSHQAKESKWETAQINDENSNDDCESYSDETDELHFLHAADESSDTMDDCKSDAMDFENSLDERDSSIDFTDDESSIDSTESKSEVDVRSRASLIEYAPSNQQSEIDYIATDVMIPSSPANSILKFLTLSSESDVSV